MKPCSLLYLGSSVQGLSILFILRGKAFTLPPESGEEGKAGASLQEQGASSGVVCSGVWCCLLLNRFSTILFHFYPFLGTHCRHTEDRSKTSLMLGKGPPLSNTPGAFMVTFKDERKYSVLLPRVQRHWLPMGSVSC